MTTWNDTYEVSTAGSVALNTGTGTVDSFADSAAFGVEWRYTINKSAGANMRTGFIMADWDLVADSTPEMKPDNHSPDIGTTMGVVTFSVDKSGNSVRLRATCTSDGWTIYWVRTLIGATS